MYKKGLRDDDGNQRKDQENYYMRPPPFLIMRLHPLALRGLDGGGDTSFLILPIVA